MASPLEFATEAEIRNAVNAGPGSLGPVNMPLPIVIDRSVAVMSDFGAGANIDGKHYFGINWERDLALPEALIYATLLKETQAQTVKVYCKLNVVSKLAIFSN